MSAPEFDCPVDCLVCGETFDEYDPAAVVRFTLAGTVEGWCPEHRAHGFNEEDDDG